MWCMCTCSHTGRCLVCSSSMPCLLMMWVLATCMCAFCNMPWPVCKCTPPHCLDIALPCGIALHTCECSPSKCVTASHRITASKCTAVSDRQTALLCQTVFELTANLLPYMNICVVCVWCVCELFVHRAARCWPQRAHSLPTLTQRTLTARTLTAHTHTAIYERVCVYVCCSQGSKVLTTARSLAAHTHTAIYERVCVRLLSTGQQRADHSAHTHCPHSHCHIWTCVYVCCPQGSKVLTTARKAYERSRAIFYTNPTSPALRVRTFVCVLYWSSWLCNPQHPDVVPYLHKLSTRL